MARGAGVGSPCRPVQIRPRHAEPVIPPPVDTHVDLPRHVTALALRSFGADRVERVLRIVVERLPQRREPLVTRRRMALRTDRVTLSLQRHRVRIVAVAAPHATRVHLGLQERPVLVVLRLDLPVSEVCPVPEKCQIVAVVIRRARQRIAVTKVLAPRMASGALLDLGIGRLREIRGQPLRGQPRPARRLIAGRVGRPGVVRLTRPMAGLAAHADLGLPRRIGSARRIVIPAEPRGVARGAPRLPVLVRPRPVQPVVLQKHLIGIKIVPALRDCVPGDVERLRPPRLGRQQVLLQGMNPRDPDHVEAPPRPGSVLGLDDVCIAPPAEPRDHAPALEAHVAEITEHRGLVRQRPGQRMVRTRPARRLVGMAGGAARRPGIVRRRRHLRSAGQKRPCGIGHNEEQQPEPDHAHTLGGGPSAFQPKAQLVRSLSASFAAGRTRRR